MQGIERFNLEGKRILVTGAGRGIGRALVKALYYLKADVYALSLTKENLNSLRVECPEIHTVCVDLRDWEKTKEALSQITESMDGLVNNAGILIPAPIGLFAITPEDCDTHFDLNVKAVINVSQQIAQKMIKSGRGGSIVNLSSAASKVHTPIAVSYAICKGALDVLTKNMACELGAHKIRVNSVNPFFVDETHSLEKLVTALPIDMMEKITENVCQRCPMGRSAIEVRDVLNSILFLLSDASRYINGQNLMVDGGFTIA